MTNQARIEDIPDWEYAKEGIVYWLNNDPDKAERHFKAKLDSNKVFSSYAFTTVVNALISYEIDKIEIAQEMLREVERRCSPPTGWIQALKSRIFGPDDTSTNATGGDLLEERIIVADALMCSAILTFLTQDIGGLMKGSWLLRRAWKIYEQLYGQVYDLYVSRLGRNEAEHTVCDPVTPSSINVNTNSTLRNHMQQSRGNSIKNGYKHKAKDNTTRKQRNCTNQLSHSVSTTFSSELPQLPNYAINKSTNPAQNENTSEHPSKKNLYLSLPSNSCNELIHQVPLSCPCPHPTPSPIAREQITFSVSDIDLKTIKRLMGAVSFGFGIFQLSVSLLPPNLLKLISFLGFEGNRTVGIACLNFARTTEDMRAPLSTLVLLWYYTIGAQLFHSDDSNFTNEMEVARQLLKESRPQYSTSAIFLFFNARLKRLQGKTNIAIDLYDAAYRMSALRELKMLCLHEVGWCRLIHLDFGNAMLHFHELKLASSFSKSFYAYMTTICQGAFGRFDNLIRLKNELTNMLRRNNYKETQIDKFLIRRLSKLPSSPNDRKMFDAQYWKFFVYEMLFLWNTLPNCPSTVIETIISDCTAKEAATNEPSIGLAKLIAGACKMHLKQLESAVEEFRECIRKRIDATDDIYISAYANYELAAVLLKQKNEMAKQEAKSLLLNVQRLYKNYDFENRLSARVYDMLKNL